MGNKNLSWDDYKNLLHQEKYKKITQQGKNNFKGSKHQKIKSRNQKLNFY